MSCNKNPYQFNNCFPLGPTGPTGPTHPVKSVKYPNF